MIVRPNEEKLIAYGESYRYRRGFTLSNGGHLKLSGAPKVQPIQSDMQLTRSGNRVNGTYNSGEGLIGGTIDAQGIWIGTWSDSTGKGSFSVAFSDDAKTFYGNWKYSDSKGWDGVFEGKKTVAPNIA